MSTIFYLVYSTQTSIEANSMGLRSSGVLSGAGGGVARGGGDVPECNRGGMKL
jgi:hypothetical protein